MVQCPGQDRRFWKPEDIFESACPHCGTAVEFWKDDPKRQCPGCARTVRNPKIDIGCAEWCDKAKECLGTAEQDPSPRPSPRRGEGGCEEQRIVPSP
jgi:hypothetical protein